MKVAAVYARAALTLILLLTACAPAATSKLPVSCGTTSGDQTGAETQRFIEATDTQVVLTFDASAASNVFGVPAFEISR